VNPGMIRDFSDSYTVELNEKKGLRADRYIAEHLEIFSRSQIKNRNLKVLLNDKEIKLSKLLFDGDKIQVEYDKPEALQLLPEKIHLDIIYEDNNSVVINKSQGMVVHPGAGNYTGTLVHGLLYYCLEMKDKFPVGDLRPGIVHRLDKDTSGVIISAKNQETHNFLSTQFKNRSTKKQYIAIVKGVPLKQEGTIEINIARDLNNRKKFTVSKDRGKPAVSFYKVIETWNNFSLVVLKLETGRTHQLRVHMLYLGNPILGDSIYSRNSGLFPDITLMLHAYMLELKLPDKKNTTQKFKAPIPERFLKIIEFYSKNPSLAILKLEEALD
jgi:23S rRNA pseudouridine1911/1915/1917 synthase